MLTETEEYYELSEDKVCQFYAELLLRPAGKVIKAAATLAYIDVFNLLYSFLPQFNYHEFMESWQQSVPDGMTTSLGQLKVC